MKIAIETDELRKIIGELQVKITTNNSTIEIIHKNVAAANVNALALQDNNKYCEGRISILNEIIALEAQVKAQLAAAEIPAMEVPAPGPVEVKDNTNHVVPV